MDVRAVMYMLRHCYSCVTQPVCCEVAQQRSFKVQFIILGRLASECQRECVFCCASANPAPVDTFAGAAKAPSVAPVH